MHKSPRTIVAAALVGLGLAATLTAPASAAPGGPWYEWSVKASSPRAAYAAPCNRRAGEHCTVTKVLPGRYAPTGTRYMKFPKGTVANRVGGRVPYSGGRWYKEPLAPSTVWVVVNR